MAAPNSNRRLGRGLAALIGDEITEHSAIETARAFRQVPIEFLRANPNNPRKVFKPGDLEELSKSVALKGMLQPILVRPVAGEKNAFEIVAGERRWRAAQQAYLHDVPVMVRELNDAEALEIAIVENVQRTDLNPIEEAQGYKKLIEQFNYTQQKLGEVVGKSRSHIANMLRLTGLPDEVQTYLSNGDLTAGHARALVVSDNPTELANQIVTDKLTVRDAERMGKGLKPVKQTARKSDEKSPDTIALERNLSDALGLRVELNERASGGGELKIHYRSLEQLDDICTRLMRLR